MKFNGLIPELSVSSVNESKKFYIDILGFHLEYERVEDKFAFLSYGESQIMLEEINGHRNTGELQCPFDRGINFQIATDDVSKIACKLKQHNITLFRDIVESRYKCDGEVIVEKEILFQDPDGYLLRFSQTKSNEKPEDGWASIEDYLKIIKEENKNVKIMFEHRPDLISDEELDSCYSWISEILGHN